MKINYKPDVVVIGELNVDIILNQISQFPEIGKEILAENLTVTLGSSSAILASNLSTLGTSVAFIGKIGNDSFGNVVLESLKSKGVNISNVIKSEVYNTGATIVLNYEQDRAMITYPGAMNDFCSDDIDMEFLFASKHVHFSSIFLQPGIRNNLSDVFRKAKSKGLSTSLDPQWDPEEKWDINMEELLPNVDLFLPNIAEFKFITKTSNLNEGFEKIRKIAPEVTLILKDGSNGAFAWKAGSLIHQPAFLNTSVVDCIGAGDSFNAGYICDFIKGKSIEQCLKTGAIAGAISTTRAGGTSAFSKIEDVKKIAHDQFNQEINI